MFGCLPKCWSCNFCTNVMSEALGTIHSSSSMEMTPNGYPEKCTRMNLPKRDELLLRTVLAFPKASSTGCLLCCTDDSKVFDHHAEITFLQVVEHRGFIQECQVSHVFSLCKFRWVHLLSFFLLAGIQQFFFESNGWEANLILSSLLMAKKGYPSSDSKSP
uniref:Uncharacterized protein n=1 Tax=Meloidogyne incognita TaxID=6306 RepID=A0A914KV25_MELIC